MTTRFLTTDQNGNGDQTYWDINGYFLHGPSGEKLNLGGGNTTVTASNEIVQIGTSYIRIPQGISNERPDISNSYVGMMRYLTTDNLLEYFNGQTNRWIPISLPSPTISSISPNYISFNQSGPETNSNTYTLTGSNFNNAPGGISVEAIGNNGAGTILIPNFNNASSETSVTFTFDPSGTEQLIGISNELPFAVKLINTNSGFSSLLNNAIIATNAGPEFTQPSVFTPSSFQTFAVQDPCAHFIVGGLDLSSPKHYPLDFSFVQGTAGGFNVGGGDISSVSDFSAIVQVPAGNRLDATAGSYNFTMRVTDASNAFSDANYTLSLANPTITSIDPSYIYDTSVVDINITGNYFIRDTDISFNKGSNTLTQNEVSYNSITSLTVKGVSAEEVGVYDISLANGSVIVNVPSVVLNIVKLVSWSITGYSLGSTYEVTYLDATGTGPANTVGGPVVGGSTVLTIKGSAGSGGTGTISFNTNAATVNYLLVGGGGGGGGNDATNVGGGGAGGGGGGGIIFGSATLNTLSATLNVGAGGTGGGLGGSGGTQAQPGGNSTYNLATGIGGGKGGTAGDGTSGTNPDSNATPGGSGGTGGGGAGVSSGNGGNGSIGGSGSHGGNGGGPPGSTYFRLGCGGGGGGTSGGNGTIPSSDGISTFGGSGGDGTAYTISGVAVIYGGGGGGGAGAGVTGTGVGGPGGNGGGGNGATDAGTPTNGTNFLGGGGGGADDQTDPTGLNNGGSGVIILRFPSVIT